MLLTNMEAWKDLTLNEHESTNLPASAKWVNGRVVAVLASPELGNASSYATGISLLPAGAATPWHSHEAEELALVVKGSGRIHIEEETIEVRAGDVVRTPPGKTHQTVADSASDMVVFWVYAPAGSETRWLAEAPKEG